MGKTLSRIKAVIHQHKLQCAVCFYAGLRVVLTYFVHRKNGADTVNAAGCIAEYPFRPDAECIIPLPIFL